MNIIGDRFFPVSGCGQALNYGLVIGLELAGLQMFAPSTELVQAYAENLVTATDPEDRKVQGPVINGLRDRMARYHRDVDAAFHGWNGAWLNPDFRAFDITEFLPPIQAPILGLQGTDDPYGSDEQLHVLAAAVTAPLTIRLIPGARHAPHLEAKDATLEAITAFIAGLEQD